MRKYSFKDTHQKEEDQKGSDSLTRSGSPNTKRGGGRYKKHHNHIFTTTTVVLMLAMLLGVAAGAEEEGGGGRDDVVAVLVERADAASLGTAHGNVADRLRRLSAASPDTSDAASKANEVQARAQDEAEGKNLAAEKCCACLEQMSVAVAGQEKPLDALQLPCKHPLCRGCGGNWFQRSQTCPICRAVVPPEISGDGYGIRITRRIRRHMDHNRPLLLWAATVCLCDMAMGKPLMAAALNIPLMYVANMVANSNMVANMVANLLNMVAVANYNRYDVDLATAQLLLLTWWGVLLYNACIV